MADARAVLFPGDHQVRVRLDRTFELKLSGAGAHNNSRVELFGAHTRRSCKYNPFVPRQSLVVSQKPLFTHWPGYEGQGSV
jgi:hypothetical protein